MLEHVAFGHDVKLDLMARLLRADGTPICDVVQLVFHGPMGPDGAEFRGNVPSDLGLGLTCGSLFVLQTDSGRRYPATVMQTRSCTSRFTEIRGRVGTAQNVPRG